MLCIRYQLGLSLISRVLPTAITACVPWRQVLLPQRHVHQVHQVHLAKCFVTRLAPQLLSARSTCASVPLPDDFSLSPGTISQKMKYFDIRYSSGIKR